MDNIIVFQEFLREKGGVLMCMPIKRIYGKSAYEILEEYGNPNEIPIDLERLLENIGISARPEDFTALEKKLNKGHILGLVLSNKTDAIIYYGKKESLNRQRFTIAHELGHICNHIEPRSDDYAYIDWRIEEEAETKQEEIDANIFAGELLIPLKKLKEIYLSMKYPSSSELASIFGTSINVMEKRLEHLGVSYYNEKGQAITYGIY